MYTIDEKTKTAKSTGDLSQDSTKMLSIKRVKVCPRSVMVKVLDWHKTDLRLVQAPGPYPRNARRLQNTTGPVGIPLERGASGARWLT